MKIVIISYCGDCPLRFYKGNVLFCEKTDKETNENDPCPEWCPLPDPTKSDFEREKEYFFKNLNRKEI